MRWKEFFKPSVGKTLLALILLILIAPALIILVHLSLGIFGLLPVGVPMSPLFPIPFYGQSMVYDDQPYPTTRSYFSVEALVVDVIFWYLVSCIIFETLGRRRKRKKGTGAPETAK